MAMDVIVKGLLKRFFFLQFIKRKSLIYGLDMDSLVN